MSWLIGLTGFALGMISCALLAIVEYGAWALVLPHRASRQPRETTDAPIESSAADAQGGRGNSLSIVASDGVKLVGSWYPATGSEPTGRTVILLHGFAESPGNLQAQRVAALNAHGWNAAVLDLRGYGRSEGPLASFGGRESGDVRAWLGALADRLGPALALEPVLWGRSMGAAIALRAAAEGSVVEALVLESPMVDLDEAVAVWLRKRRLPFPRPLARLITRRAGRLAGVSLTRPRVLDLAPRVSCPVLIIHGGDDTLVTEPGVRGLAAAFPNEPRLIEVPGAGHGDVVAVGGTEVIEEVIIFLNQAATLR
jgi:alpha-beta hydrolase superfamily lysophospholipase